jgi:hypothetical protein
MLNLVSPFMGALLKVPSIIISANNKISEKSRSGIENMQKDPPSSTKYPKN